jgi:succinyl-diaminopimelate desuccinylase
VADLLTQLLKIPSKTYQEQALVLFIKNWIHEKVPQATLYEYQDSLIIVLTKNPRLPHLALVGHLDVVPDYFEPYIEDDRFYGAGASDMKAALASFLSLFGKYSKQARPYYNLSLILYAREEGTPLTENGLFHLIEYLPTYFRGIDLAIVGEPTNNTIQLGCVGSLHLTLTFPGEACHSARPWEGKNALYTALPFLQKIADFAPQAHTICGVRFFDVLQITECSAEPGRTTLPGWFKAHLNFRFAPLYTEDEARKKLQHFLIRSGIQKEWIHWLDSVPASPVLETPIFHTILKELQAPLEAKQAWTDVAQLTQLEIPSFNYGPGLPQQAHKKQEYCSISQVEHYLKTLQKLVYLDPPPSP